MYTDEICIGFDCRINERRQSARPALSSKQILSRQLYPLSGDPLVWPRPDGAEIIADAGTGNNPLGLAQSAELVNQMSQRLETISGEVPQIIALTCAAVCVDVIEEKFGPGWFNKELTSGMLHRNGWVLLGFDVLDMQGLISGVSGCGYSEAAREMMLKRFHKALNSRGLFASHRLASEFATARGLQIRAHAPFVPVSIYRKGSGYTTAGDEL